MSDIGFYTGVIETPVFSRQKSTVFMVILILPEKLRESVTIQELQKVHGEFPMNFPHLFPPGTILCWEGYKWEITHYEFSPTLYGSHKQKTIPRIHTEFIYGSDP